MHSKKNIKLVGGLIGAVGCEGWNNTDALRSFGSFEKARDGAKQLDVA